MQHICESSTQPLDCVRIPNQTIKVLDYPGQKSQLTKIGFLNVIFSLWGLFARNRRKILTPQIPYEKKLLLHVCLFGHHSVFAEHVWNGNNGE